MRAILVSAVVLCGLSGAAATEPLYDVKIERAVMELVAGRIGDIRAGLNFRHVAEPVQQAEPAVAPALPGGERWIVVTTPEATSSRTVGSIQTYASDTLSPAPGEDAPTSRNGQKVPRVLKF